MNSFAVSYSYSCSKLLSRFQYRGQVRRRGRFKIPFMGLIST
ncbi:hypothetical protein D1AOALGA4SA_7340 [Olavius algarvensis Delta 1 endosymbiont]|nr:hypothetical protein D1AOALGA4SA_7340 [Olavius algarvensis Delta 1 endosymbiont]